MNELIPIQYENENPTVSGRELHAAAAPLEVRGERLVRKRVAWFVCGPCGAERCYGR